MSLVPPIEERVAVRLAAASSAPPSWIPPGEHFVVIVENDSGRVRRYEWDAFGIPHLAAGCSYDGETITFEHYLGKNTTAAQVKAHAAMLRGRYGRVAVAKLVIVEADK